MKRFLGHPSDTDREVRITTSAKKSVTLQYIPIHGEPVLLAKETTTFKGVFSVEKEITNLQWQTAGDGIKGKNRIRLEFEV